VRQLLANKVSGTLVGVWLLIPELLRLGVWELLCGWTRQTGTRIEPRLALQLVNESALCVNAVRARRCLSQKGFELANGLPFVASDRAVHDLLNERTVADTRALQIALGRIRATTGDFSGRLLALDPHRMPSASKRQMPQQRPKPELPARKCSQGFFSIDATTSQPLCCTLASSGRTVAQATPELLEMTQQILRPAPGQALVMADGEHFVTELICSIARQTPFDLLTPIPNQPAYRRQLREIPATDFVHRWAGMATAKKIFRLADDDQPLWQFIERDGEIPEQYRYRGFLCTADREEVDALTKHYPERWHAEEFFNLYQDMGWKKAGTMNLNIRYGRMTTTLIAQAATAHFRQRIAEPIAGWTATHLANNLFRGLDGDIRVAADRIIVTYYNAPYADRLRQHYEGLPQKLLADGINPKIPWLYDFQLDFRFR